MGMNNVHLTADTRFQTFCDLRLLSHLRWSQHIQSQKSIHSSLSLSLYGFWHTLHQYVWPSSPTHGWDSGTSMATGAACLVDVPSSKRTCVLCASFLEITHFFSTLIPISFRHTLTYFLDCWCEFLNCESLGNTQITDRWWYLLHDFGK